MFYLVPVMRCQIPGFFVVGADDDGVEAVMARSRVGGTSASTATAAWIGIGHAVPPSAVFGRGGAALSSRGLVSA